MKLPRRNFLHLAAGAAALPAVSRIARAQAYPTRPVRVAARACRRGNRMKRRKLEARDETAWEVWR
jgi:Flp pilus assembly protein CpaB